MFQKNKYSVFLLTLLLLLCVGCTHIQQDFYNQTLIGTYHGTLIIRYYGPDLFQFLPDEDDPFYFERSNGEKIYPPEMVTDGGSTPSFLWGIRIYSPWAYGPAYIVHDGLYAQHRCHPEQLVYDFQESAAILAEAMKTLMEDPETEHIKNVGFLHLIYIGVLTEQAREAWNTGCGRTLLPDRIMLFEQRRVF